MRNDTGSALIDMSESASRGPHRVEMSSASRTQGKDNFNHYERNLFPTKGTGVNRNLAHMSANARRAFQEEAVELLSRNGWSYFITLTFHYEVVSGEKASEIVGRFISRLSSAAFGSRSKKRVKVAIALERFDSGAVHVHLVMEDIVSRIYDPDKASRFDVRAEVIKAWKESDSRTASPLRADPRGNKWFQRIYDENAVLGYITKDVCKGSQPIVLDELSLEGRRIQ